MKNAFIFIFMATLLWVVGGTAAIMNPTNSSDNTEVVMDNAFEKGWEAGYCAGWKSIKGPRSVCPVAPVGPVPVGGDDSYDDGYARAYPLGRSKASN